MPRSTRITFLLPFITAFLFKIAGADVPIFWNPDEAALMRETIDDIFCNNNNSEVQNGCEGPPGTCLYPVLFNDRRPCHTYVKCVIDEESLHQDKKTAKAQLRYCSGAPESAEFSSVTRKCEPKGAPGTCSSQRQEHHLAPRKNKEGNPDLTQLETERFCMNNPEVAAGCKVEGGCKYAASKECNYYVQCVMDLGENSTTATARYRSCPQWAEATEFSSITKKCEPFGSPGTCSAKRKEHHLVVRDGGLPPWAHQDNPEQAAEQEFVDWYFCNNNNHEVANDCKVEGGCKYARGDNCWSYIECVMFEAKWIKKARAHFKYCPQRPNDTEFSSVTRKCEPLGTPGTCSYNKQQHHLAERANTSDLATPGWILSISCGPDPKYHPDGGECHKGFKNCSFGIGGDCSSYVECHPGFLGFGTVKRCSPGQMYNHRYTRQCEPANANGTCWQYHQSNNLAERARTSVFTTNEISEKSPSILCDNINSEVAASCTGPNDCRFSLPGNCSSYVQCKPGQNPTGEVKHCPPGQEYSTKTRQCEFSGAPGTCSAGKTVSNLAKRTEDSTQVPTKVDRSLPYQHGSDELFCSLDAVQKAGCQIPTNCSYPVPEFATRNDFHKCNTYVSCTANPEADRKTGKFASIACPIDKEFSNKTMTCEPAGAPGTCSEKHQLELLDVRTSTSVPANTTSVPDREISDRFKCCDQDEHGNCTKSIVGRFSNSKDCHSYIECVANPADGNDRENKEGLPLIKQCPHGEEDKPMEWNSLDEKCDWAGAPGTCSEKTQQPTLRVRSTEISTTAGVERQTLHVSEHARKEFECPKFTEKQCEDKDDQGRCYIAYPGRCNAFVDCSPYALKAEKAYGPPGTPILFFCNPGEYWDAKDGGCKYLTKSGGNSTCEVSKNIKCPRNASAREDCEASPFGGYFCSSSKGPQWYIPCIKDTKANDKQSYNIRCPLNWIFDLDRKGGPGCRDPNVPDNSGKWDQWWHGTGEVA